ncbi:MAG: hypothetical protein J3R72DRAFT_528628 [Linnemannia gamsii]|nr:MAG: hypothetical protein J3R72DRAFT_528628 [Linnemannia gamsii]
MVPSGLNMGKQGSLVYIANTGRFCQQLQASLALARSSRSMGFTPYTDKQIDTSVNLFSSIDLVMELLCKLEIKNICVVKTGEHYWMIHKKRLLSLLKENDEKQKRNVRSRCF